MKRKLLSISRGYFSIIFDILVMLKILHVFLELNTPLMISKSCMYLYFMFFSPKNLHASKICLSVTYKFSLKLSFFFYKFQMKQVFIITIFLIVSFGLPMNLGTHINDGSFDTNLTSDYQENHQFLDHLDIRTCLRVCFEWQHTLMTENMHIKS